MNKQKKTSIDFTKVMWGVFLVVSIIYLANPTAGIIELIPDNLPIIGNLDEAGATLLLVHSLKQIF